MTREDARLAAVRRYAVLDTPPDGAFDRITALAARHFGVPIAIVSIVDRDRIWFKSHHGVEAQEIGRDPGLCASAIMHDGPWVVENAAVDPRTLANPLVAGELGLRFYAGAPLTTHDGFNLGTLCVIDQEPRRLSDGDTETLTDLAAIVMDELELRLAAQRAVERESELRDQAERTARALQESLLPSRLPDVPGAELATLYQPADRAEVTGDFYDVFPIDGAWALVVGDVSGKGAAAAAVTALARNAIRTAFLATASPAAALKTLNRAMFVGLGDELPDHHCTAVVGVLRPASGGFLLTLASAGHPPPALARPGQAPVELDGAAGPPVGWHAEPRFIESEQQLRPGDSLVLYTDGLSEARTPDGFFGSRGICSALEAAGAVPAAALAGHLADALTSEGVEVRDDAAALIVRVS
jgi:sigma-B regulation protein RsbU (phosphoserine phosphatase)